MSTIWTFDGIENKHDAYRGEGCMKKSREFLKEQAVKIINFQKKETIPLPKEAYESCPNEINCHMCKTSLNLNALTIRIS